MPWLVTSTYFVCKESFYVVIEDIGFTIATDLNISLAKVNIWLRRVL